MYISWCRCSCGWKVYHGFYCLIMQLNFAMKTMIPLMHSWYLEKAHTTISSTSEFIVICGTCGLENEQVLFQDCINDVLHHCTSISHIFSYRKLMDLANVLIRLQNMLVKFVSSKISGNTCAKHLIIIPRTSFYLMFG